jgi:C1A family cysteine protease
VTAVQQELFDNGPLITSFKWTKAMQAYSTSKTRIFREKDWLKKGEEHSELINYHSAVVLGWDFDEQGTLFWIIQNSHGKGRGDKGIMYLYADEADILKEDFISLTNVILV